MAWTNELSIFKKIINHNCHFKPGVALGWWASYIDSHDTGKATIIKGWPLPVINGVTSVSRVIAQVTRLFSVFSWNSTYNDRLGDENSSPWGHRLDTGIGQK